MIDTIADLLQDEELPVRVTNRILFGGLQEIYRSQVGAAEQRAELKDQIDCIISEGRKTKEVIDANTAELEERVEDLEESLDTAPSITWLLINRPKDTIKTLAILTGLITGILALSEPLRILISSLIF